MQEVPRPLVEIPDADVEPFAFYRVGQGLAPKQMIVRIYPSTPWSLQREPTVEKATGEKATLGPRQVAFCGEEARTFRVCGVCGVKVPIRLSTSHFGNQRRAFFEDRPETCYGCGATFEPPRKRETSLILGKEATMRALRERLKGYVGKELTLELLDYSFCTEETHPPHGSIGIPGRRSLVFQGLEKQPIHHWDFHEGIYWKHPGVDDVQEYIGESETVRLKDVCVCGLDPEGREVAIPFQRESNWTGGYGYNVITRIACSNVDLLVSKTVFDGSERIFEHRWIVKK